MKKKLTLHCFKVLSLSLLFFSIGVYLFLFTNYFNYKPPGNVIVYTCNQLIIYRFNPLLFLFSYFDYLQGLYLSFVGLGVVLLYFFVTLFDKED
jgi:hypothetical protein